MIYKIRRVYVDSNMQITAEGKHRETMRAPEIYRVGELVFLKPHGLYRIEAMEMEKGAEDAEKDGE